MVGIVEMYKDVRATYEKNHMPKYLNIDDKKSEVKVQIQNQRIKMYIIKEMVMVNNIEPIYAKICGQHIDPLQKMINHLGKFTVKNKEKDVICLLKNLKAVSTGIDSLGYKRVNYLNVLQYFVTMRQEPLEGDDG